MKSMFIKTCSCGIEAPAPAIPIDRILPTDADLTFTSFDTALELWAPEFGVIDLQSLVLNVGYNNIGIGILIMQAYSVLANLQIDPNLTTDAWYVATYSPKLGRYITLGSPGA